MLAPKEMEWVMKTIAENTSVHFIWLTCTSNELCVLCSLTTAICNAERYREREKNISSPAIILLSSFVCIFGSVWHQLPSKHRKPKSKNEKLRKRGLVDPKQSLRETDEQINNFKNNLLFLSIFLANYILYISCHRLEEPQSSGIEQN